MPEGPETHRAADRLRRALAGRPATQVRFAFPHLRDLEPILSGEEVVEVRARGKAMLTHFGNGLVVYSHNQLYGRWYVTPAGQRPQTRRSLRLAVENAERAALLYSASEIEVWEQAKLHCQPFLASLGPDALDPELEAGALEERLGARAFRGRQLAALLLDQGFVAGLGNYLRADILFEAGVHPSRRPCDLPGPARARLAAAIPTIAQRAYRFAGATNDPDRVRRLRADGFPRRHWRHLVFARTGEPCWQCEEPIQRFEAAGRRTYVCLQCQPVP